MGASQRTTPAGAQNSSAATSGTTVITAAPAPLREIEAIEKLPNGTTQPCPAMTCRSSLRGPAHNLRQRSAGNESDSLPLLAPGLP